MPRPVVPILPAPAAASRMTSSSLCSGRISVAFSAMRRFCGLTATPCCRSRSISLRQRPRIDDDAVADDAELARAHHARRQQRQLVGLVADDQRVAGVVAALEAHDDVGALGQPVDDLALALVAPLGADHDDVCHRSLRSFTARVVPTALRSMTALARAGHPDAVIAADARSPEYPATQSGGTI